MRPTRLVLALAAVLLLAPASALAGKGGGGGGGSIFPAGDYFFLDKVSIDKIKSLAVIDQVFSEFCLTGIAAFLDTTTTLNRRIELEFRSLGTIERQSSAKVDGLFTTVDELRLTVFAGPETTDVVLFDGTLAPAPCELDGRLFKAGDKDRAILDCNVGANFADFAIPATVPDPFGEEKDVITREEILASIGFALAKKKSIKVDTERGDIRINHNGYGVDPVAKGLDFSQLDCPTSSDDID